MSFLIQSAAPDEWLRFLYMLIGLFSFVGAAELIRKYFHVEAAVTRKLVHILVGIFVFFVPLIFTSPLPPILMSLIFIVLNYFSVRSKLFKGMDNTSRETYGTVFFPLSFLLLILLYWESYPLIISASILILGLGDAAASIVGTGMQNPTPLSLTRENKSLEGSAAMISVSFIVTAGCLLFFPQRTPDSHTLIGSEVLFMLAAAFVIAVVAGVVEALSTRGTDNLTVPLTAGLMLFAILEGGEPVLSRLLAGFLAGCLISFVSLRLGVLSRSGAAATFLIALIVFGFGGWLWAIPILAFFILSSLLSKLKSVRRRSAEEHFEKTSRRDIGQVLANGGIAALCVLGYQFFEHTFWFIAYIGAIAAATADTWGTELGIAFGGRVRSVVSMDEVDPGTSGGVSLAGLLAGTAGGAIIGFTGSGFFIAQPGAAPSLSLLIAVGIVSGFSGSLIDSYIGALWQVRYTCGECGINTERREHCGSMTNRSGGIPWMNNDWVNVFCTAAGGLTAVFIFLGLT